MSFLDRLKVATRGRDALPADGGTPVVEASLLIEEGNALEDAGRLHDALALYDTAVRVAPSLARAHVNRGNALLALGRLQDAVQAYGTALVHDPDYAAAHYNLGNAHVRANRRADALAAYRRALRLKPDFADAEAALGALYEDLGQPEEAAARYRRALQINPGFTPIHASLGRVLDRLGRHVEAAASYRIAAGVAPDDMPLHFSLGNSLFRSGQYAEAADCFRQQLVANPNSVELNLNLGGALQMLGEHQAALESFARVLERKPDHAHAHNNMSQALKDLGRLDEAVASCRRALAIDPEFDGARSNLIFIQSYMAEAPAAIVLQEAQQFGEVIARRARAFATWTGLPDAERRLRVGFVSGDFRDHPVGSFVEGAFAALAAQARQQLEIHGYPTVAAADSVTARIRATCAGWQPVAHLSDAAFAEKVHEDGIDILVDLSGHTANNRLPAFAWKAAPVQATWLGFLATTGVAAIDYLVADPWTLPPSEEVHFSERIWRMPGSYLCFTPPVGAPDPGPLPASDNGYVTFGSFNHLTKMNDAVVDVWSRVLNAVPESRLFLKSRQLRNAAARDSVADRFARHGIDRSRLLLEGLVPRAQYMMPFRRLDIALDPFPYPGITTTVESMWMGVPVLTLAGTSYLSRQGTGLLLNAGLPDWICADADDYVARAAAHAGDQSRLAALRQEMRQQILASPIFDSTRFAREFETALRGMWRERCARVQTSASQP